MARLLTALVAGLVFGLGLVISQMVVPAKVLGFLDVAGDWDPSLAFVMGGAILVAAPAFLIARRMRAPALAPRFEWPTRHDVDARLLVGAVLFGVGWGLVGFCPGPALAVLGVEPGAVALFVLAMAGGMVLYQLTAAPKAASGRL